MYSNIFKSESISYNRNKKIYVFISYIYINDQIS